MRWRIIITLILLLSGCSEDNQNRVYTEERPVNAPSWWTPSFVTLNNLHIAQVSAKELLATCGPGGACYNEQYNRVLIPAFKSENDPVTTCALGEEMRHAMGMKHE